MTPDEARAVAGQLTRYYNASVERLRHDPSMSEDHRTDRLAAVWVEHAQAFGEIAARVSNATQADRAKLEAKYLQPQRSLYAQTSSERVAMDASYRDALARAGDTSGTDQLQSLLTRAMRVGDELQTKAALAIAYERMDVDAINVYAASAPDAEPDLQRLYDLSAQSSGAGRQDLMLAMHIAPPTPPPGTESRLRELAGQKVGDPKHLLEEARRAAARAEPDTPMALNDGPGLTSAVGHP